MADILSRLPLSAIARVRGGRPGLKSFTRAADEPGATQGGRQLAGEGAGEAAGPVLFNRLPCEVTLTAAGERFVAGRDRGDSSAAGGGLVVEAEEGVLLDHHRPEPGRPVAWPYAWASPRIAPRASPCDFGGVSRVVGLSREGVDPWPCAAATEVAGHDRALPHSRRPDACWSRPSSWPASAAWAEA
ncbi:hypothetical protein ACRAWD_23675 [Caulobacter segnis]